MEQHQGDSSGYVNLILDYNPLFGNYLVMLCLHLQYERLKLLAKFSLFEWSIEGSLVQKKHRTWLQYIYYMWGKSSK